MLYCRRHEKNSIALPAHEADLHAAAECHSADHVERGWVLASRLSMAPPARLCRVVDKMQLELLRFRPLQ